MLSGVTPAFGQKQGRLGGVVRQSDNTVVTGVVVTATNQVTSHVRRARSGPDGKYWFHLPVGAYRITVEGPNVRFDKEGFNPPKDAVAGPYVTVDAAGINNVIVNGVTDTTLNIPVKENKESKPLSPGPVDQPSGYSGGQTVESRPQSVSNRREVRDRWRIGFPEYDRYGDKGARGRDIPFTKGRWYDPYHQNLLKGDYPIWGNRVFMILSGVSTSEIEFNRTPKPSDVSSARPGSAQFFGKPEALVFNQILQFTFEMFHGETTFRPREWAIKISPTFSVPNYVNARENGVINIDPRRGTTRTESHASLEEAFAEVKLEDVNANFDFVSVRAGIQPFVSDFRGFIFSDNNLGARLFGGFGNNRYQFNLAYFHMLDKDTNSGLNTFNSRRQNVYIANLFRQDFLKRGYTIQGSLLYNDDRRSRAYDRNGFLVRPALIGDLQPHAIKVGYVGINGDGHLGRLNLTNSYYYAFGHDTHNEIAGRSVRISSHMAAVEASLDKDYFRFRGSAFWASGAKNPTGRTATGFDSIFDDPNFVGGQFSYWNREGIRLTQTGVGLVQPNSLLPNLRSSKIQGQANFVNPGIFIYNAGVDVDVTQRIKAIFNLNYLRFHRTESLEYVLLQNRIRKEIGWDYSVGVEYRPLLINNIRLTFGAATLRPGRGFRDIFTDRTRNCPPNVAAYCAPDNASINPSKPLYAIFAQLKLVF